MNLVLHPETGREVHTHEEFLEALTWIEERMTPLYRVRARLREEMAERYPPAPRPARRRDRTDTQEKVERCPRCGGKITEVTNAP